MSSSRKRKEQFRAITREADALPVGEINEAAAEIDYVLKLKERCKRNARNYAKKGCYRDGHAPKKSTIQNYTKTKEYQRRYEEALERSSNYQEILDGSIRSDPRYRADLQEHLQKLKDNERRRVRKNHAKKLRKIAKDYIYELPVSEYYEKHRDEIRRKETEMADAYIRSGRMLASVVKRSAPDRSWQETEELSAENWDLFCEQFDSGDFHLRLFNALQRAGIRASSALVVKLCAEDPFLGELMASEDTGEYAAFLLQQQAAALTEDSDEDAFIRKILQFGPHHGASGGESELLAARSAKACSARSG